MMSAYTVERDGDFLNFRRDGHIFYEPAIPSQADAAWFFRHMGDKRWFTDDIKRQTAQLVREAWGEEE